jgi:cysteine synthase B
MTATYPLYNRFFDSKSGSKLWDSIGNTPLLGLEKIGAGLPDEVTIYAKAEWQNPGGSVKDRAAYNIIYEAERSGKLTNNKILLDASSGNTALAYAMIAAAKGYRIALCVPENVSRELVKTLEAYGADVILTSSMEGSDGAIIRARELYASYPEKYVYLSQYDNPANWQAHYKTTGVEIWQQTAGEITHFVSGLGTSGTFMGTGRRLKEYNPSIQLVSVQPDISFHGIEGLKHMPSAIIPQIYDPRAADSNINIATEEAQEMVKRLAREEGIFAGISSGAALAAAITIAQTLSYGRIVAIFPDSGRRYVNESFWE